MATYNGTSERKLVHTALNTQHSPKRVLIGGLGVGFSVNEAVRSNDVKHVDVVEIDPWIIEWNRTYLKNVSNTSMDDPRVHVIQSDFLTWLSKAIEETYDVICLDIDNGPDWTVSTDNKALYTNTHLAQLAKLLKPGGAVSIWSAQEAPWFEQALLKYFNKVQVIRTPVPRGDDDYIYLAVL
ncbi:spermine/spermidine synthase [Bacillaceae bacterium SIJ1]|nr:spermine/spermidine synthase [Litoribacterium kuwaitense]